jgi:hypothetical protein
MTKKCSKCGKIKDVQEFCKNKRMNDGLNYTCRVCRAEISVEYRKNNKERLVEYNTQYYKNNKERIDGTAAEYSKNTFHYISLIDEENKLAGVSVTVNG